MFLLKVSLKKKVKYKSMYSQDKEKNRKTEQIIKNIVHSHGNPGSDIITGEARKAVASINPVP